MTFTAHVWIQTLNLRSREFKETAGRLFYLMPIRSRKTAAKSNSARNGFVLSPGGPKRRFGQYKPTSCRTTVRHWTFRAAPRKLGEWTIFLARAMPRKPASTPGAPLAARMRPRSLDEYLGQPHILGPGKLLRRAIESDRLSSIIFYGPPGSGKTSLAQIIAATTKSHFERLSGVESSVADIRRVAASAAFRRSIERRANDPLYR